MTRVIQRRRRPLMGESLVSIEDAQRLRLDDIILARPVRFPWWFRVIQWVAVKIFRSQPAAPGGSWKVVAVDHASGRVMLEEQS